MKKVKNRFCVVLPVSLMNRVKRKSKDKGITYSRWIADAIQFTLKFGPYNQPPVSPHILTNKAIHEE